MADQNKDLKQLRIKSSGLKRISKEYVEYKKEEEKQRNRISKLQDNLADEHDINK
jgi:tubulin-specific chaperone A